MSLSERMHYFARSVRAAGWTPTIRYNLDRLRGSLGKPSRGVLRLQPKGVRYPFTIRAGESSDIAVFRQIFLEEQYRMSNPPSAVRSILDVGANIGLASISFLNRFPEARVLAVEPDPGNYRICLENLAPYGARARVLLGALWPRCTRLALSRGGDQREWATTVAEPEDAGEVTVQSWDMPTLLAMAGFETVDLLKIDIEGSERDLFEEPCEPWLARVRNVCIELHGKQSEEAFYRAMSAFAWEAELKGEVVACRNIRLR